MPISTPPQSPGLILLTSQVVAAPVAAVDFTARIDATYEEYWLSFQNLLPSGAAQIYVRTSSDGGATFPSGGADYFDSTGNVAQITMSIATQISTDATHGGASGLIRLMNPAKATGYKALLWEIASARLDLASFSSGRGAGLRKSAAAQNAIRIFADSGNIVSGLFKLYGVRKQ